MPAAGPHGLRPSPLTVPTPRRSAACHSCSPAAVAVRAADSDTASANTTVAVLTPRANIQGAEDDSEAVERVQRIAGADLAPAGSPMKTDNIPRYATEKERLEGALAALDGHFKSARVPLSDEASLVRGG